MTNPEPHDDITYTDEQADDLQAFLEGEEPAWEEEPAAPPDPARVNAMIARYKRLIRDRTGLADLAEMQRQQVNRWEDEKSEPIARQMEWLEASLRAYHEEVFKRDKLASISFPNGDLVSTKRQPEWEYPDPEAFMAWAREHMPALVVQPPAPPARPDKVEAKRLLTKRDSKGNGIAFGVTETGERPPGLTVTVPDPTDRTYGVK